MGGGVEEIKQWLLQAFPGLKGDTGFRVTSKRTPVYNCIAWAYHYSDRWMWPHTTLTSLLDGVTYWPTEDISSDDVSTFIEAFKLKGYEICDSPEHEEGYQKIALYTVPGTTRCTHAARELSNGYWTSKLGELQDIQHGTPFSLEGYQYGEAKHFMKRPFR